MCLIFSCVFSADVIADASGDTDGDDEKRVSVVGLTLFLVESFIIVACVVTLVRRRQQQLNRRWARFRRRQRSNVESLVDYQLVELRQESN